MGKTSSLTVVTNDPGYYCDFEEAGLNVKLVSRMSQVYASLAEIKRLAIADSMVKTAYTKADRTMAEFLCPDCLEEFDVERDAPVECPSCGGTQAWPVVEEDSSG
jgi:Zn finger protein HypA/HybF involved in hydrogenase expression